MKTAVFLPQIPCLYFLFKERFYVFSKARLTVCAPLLVSTNSKLPVFFIRKIWRPGIIVFSFITPINPFNFAQKSQK
jgi:hypothetical protein